MSEENTIQDWVEEADSLIEFVELVDGHGTHVDIQESNLDHLLWGRDVPRDRALKILREEHDRLEEYDSVSVSESSRAPRYMDLNDLELVSGYEFEHILAEILSRINGDAIVTDASGDQGVDVVWYRETTTIGIQAKAYDKNNPVGNSAVQEIYTGVVVRGSEYSIDTPAVVTTSRYTAGAREAAENSDVVLFGRSDLKQWLSEAELDAAAIGELLDDI